MTQEPKLTFSQRASDYIANFGGSWLFVFSLATLLGAWMFVESAPWLLMNLFLTILSTFQSPVIMMSQNRQMERDRDAVQGLHDKLDALAKQLEERTK